MISLTVWVVRSDCMLRKDLRELNRTGSELLERKRCPNVHQFMHEDLQSLPD